MGGWQVYLRQKEEGPRWAPPRRQLNESLRIERLGRAPRRPTNIGPVAQPSSVQRGVYDRDVDAAVDLLRADLRAAWN